MANETKITGISDKERSLLISRLVDELPVLRTKLGASQDDLANLIGISRQTYSSIETKRRKMSALRASLWVRNAIFSSN